MRSSYHQPPAHMAISQTDLDNIDAAIASGELSVEVNGRKITYRSIGELLKARNHVAQTIAIQVGSNNNTAITVQFGTRWED